MPDKRSEPTFTRGEVAKILNITPLTISNREKQEKYPPPKRDINNYRIYSLSDVFHLQRLTYDRPDTRPIISLLYDKGWRNMKDVGIMIEQALSRQKGY